MKVLVALFCLVAIAAADVLVSPTVVSSGAGVSSIIQSSPVFDLSDSKKCHKVSGLRPGIYKIHSDGCVEFLSDTKSREARQIFQGTPTIVNQGRGRGGIAQITPTIVNQGRGGGGDGGIAQITPTIVNQRGNGGIAQITPTVVNQGRGGGNVPIAQLTPTIINQGGDGGRRGGHRNGFF